MNETPEVMMPSFGLPLMTLVHGLVSFHSAISARFLRNFKCARRAKAGIITRLLTSRTKCAGAGAGTDARGRTGVCVWQTRVVGRSITTMLPAFGKFIGGEREIVGFLRVGRLEHRDASGDGIAAVVLLVLARSHAGVVSGNQHQGAGHPRVGGGEERVGGHVDADVLHRGNRARSGKRRPNGHFESHLFIGRPLGFAAQFGEVFKNFGRRRPRITRAQRHSGVERSQGNGLVAAQ
jgi:hypothetical protein